MSHSQHWAIMRVQPHSLMLITVLVKLWPEGHWCSHREVGSLSTADLLMGFEPETPWILSEYLNSLGHFSSVPWFIIIDMTIFDRDIMKLIWAPLLKKFQTNLGSNFWRFNSKISKPWSKTLKLCFEPLNTQRCGST